jgi:type I restriction enzyme S subunit
MTTAFELKPLGELIIANPKSKLKVRDSSSDGDYLFYTSGKKINYYNEYLCEGENIFLATGGMANVNYYHGKAAYSTDCLSITTKSNVLVKYLYYFILSKLDYINEHMFVGAALKHLQKNHFKDILVPIPDELEQKRIVEILDSTLSNNNQILLKTEQSLAGVNELFQSYLQKLFSNRNENWYETTIGEQITLQRGFDITKKQQRAGNIPVVSSGGVKSHHDTYKVEGPGVVIGRKGSLGTVYYLEENYWPHDTTLWIKEFHNNDPRLVYFLFLGLDVKHLDTGAANPALNRNLVHPIKIQWPQKILQESVINTLNELFEKVEVLKEVYKNKFLLVNELEKSILQKAFSGELA